VEEGVVEDAAGKKRRGTSVEGRAESGASE